MRARQESGNRPALGRARRKGDPKRAVRKRRKVRGQEGPREGGTARIEKFPVAPCREEPSLRTRAAPAIARRLLRNQTRDPKGSARTTKDPTPNLPRTAGIRHPRRRGFPLHARADRNWDLHPHDGGDPREPRGSAQNAVDARATKRVARRPPAPTRRCSSRHPRSDYEYDVPPVQGLSRPPWQIAGSFHPIPELRVTHRLSCNSARPCNPHETKATDASPSALEPMDNHGARSVDSAHD